MVLKQGCEKHIFSLEARIAEVHHVSKFCVARKRVHVAHCKKIVHYGGERDGETEK